MQPIISVQSQAKKKYTYKSNSAKMLHDVKGDPSSWSPKRTIDEKENNDKGRRKPHISRHVSSSTPVHRGLLLWDSAEGSGNMIPAQDIRRIT